MTTPNDRSLSRGRELTSTGRGGIGNIHATVDLTRPDSGPDDFSLTRGREPAVNPDKVLSTGRGGVGNIRSPSRDTSAVHHSSIRPDQRQQELLKAESDRVQVFSTGRGGAGNMSRSRSRGPVAFAQENAEIAAVRSRSASRDPEQRSQSKDKHPSGVSGFLHKVLHQHREEENEGTDLSARNVPGDTPIVPYSRGRAPPDARQ